MLSYFLPGTNVGGSSVRGGPMSIGLTIGHDTGLSHVLIRVLSDVPGRFQVVERALHSLLLPHEKPHG